MIKTNQNYIHEENVRLLISELPYCLSISKLSSRLLPENMNKAIPFRGLEWPRGFQEVKVPRFHDNGTGWW
jgi:hypothetical protein